MLTLSLIIALMLERIFPDLQAYRSDKWIARYWRILSDRWKLDRYGSLSMLGFMVIPVVLLISAINSVFSSDPPNLLTLAFYIVVVYLCLGSRNLDRDIDAYLEAISESDHERATQVAKAMLGGGVNSEPQAQIKQVAGGIFVLANRNFYSVIFWMVVGGPIILVAYRLIERIATQTYKSDIPGLNELAGKIMAWLEWIPALLSGVSFLICGNFDAGLKRMRDQILFDLNVSSVNDNYLQQVGLASIRTVDAVTEIQMLEVIKASRGLVLRALVLWIGFVALFQYW